jgi:chromosome segregation ATPase
MADLIERLTNPEATEQLIGMVSYEAATWRVEPNRERDAVEEAGFLDAVAHTLEALRTALSQEREAREKAEKDAEQARVELGEAMLVIEQQDRDLETVQGKLEAVWNKSVRLEASLAEAKRLLKALRDAFESARYEPGDHPVVPVKIAAFMQEVERILSGAEP